MGNGVATNQLMKMVAGAINPGRPVANLYVRIASSVVGVGRELTPCSILVLHVES